MNLGTLRATLLALRSWESTGTVMNSRIQAIIWTAMQRMAADCASALVPSAEHAELFADRTSFGSPTTAGFEEMTWWHTADEYVIELLNAAGAPFADPLPADAVVPTTDGSWDWRMHIELVDAAGMVIRRTCREFWTVVTQGVSTQYFVALDRQIRAPAAPYSMPFRIFQPYYYTSSLVRRVLSHGLWTDSRDRLLPLSMASAELAGDVDFRGQSTGRPCRVREGPHVQVPAPNVPPTLAQADPAPLWTGPEPPGSFTVRYTICYGRRTVEWQESPGVRLQDPLWESAMSPGATIELVETAPGDYGALVIGLPDIAWEQNFHDVTGIGWIRDMHSGVRLRIYVTRNSVIAGGLADEVDNMEFGNDIPYLLAEVISGTPGYIWIGDFPPDYFRRLPLSSGYYGWSVWPHQDDDYTVDMRVLHNLVPLISDSDYVPFREDALPAFLELCLYYMAVLDGVDIETAKVHEDNYERLIGKVAADHGNRAPVVERQSWYSDDAPACGIPGWNQTRTP